MVLRVAIVGPGRVGSALGRQLRGPRVELLGFVGRNEAAATRACAWAGQGRVLHWADLRAAHVVIFAVGDADLATAVVAAVAASAQRSCALWLHTSGRFGLEVFRDAGLHVETGQPQVRLGALHPVAPFPDAEQGFRNLPGAPGVWLGEARSERLLVRLCHLLGLVPIQDRAGDRVLYHAACALAANGLTALRSQVDAVFAGAGGLDRADAARLADALMGSALRSCAALGPQSALSGPVLRGDAGTVVAHLRSLEASVPAVRATYVALMQAALALAVARGLPQAAADAVQNALSRSPSGPDPGVQPRSGD